MPISFKVLLTLAVSILVIVFSPLVLSPGEAGPWVLGMPRVLWAGILASILLVIITFGLSASLKKVSQEEKSSKREL